MKPSRVSTAVQAQPILDYSLSCIPGWQILQPLAASSASVPAEEPVSSLSSSSSESSFLPASLKSRLGSLKKSSIGSGHTSPARGPHLRPAKPVNSPGSRSTPSSESTSESAPGGGSSLYSRRSIRERPPILDPNWRHSTNCPYGSGYALSNAVVRAKSFVVQMSTKLQKRGRKTSRS